MQAFSLLIAIDFMGLLDNGELETFEVLILVLVTFAEVPLIDGDVATILVWRTPWPERGLDKTGTVTFVDERYFSKRNKNEYEYFKCF
jgi:hypothetical protein